MDWIQSTDSTTKAIVAENDMRNRIRQSCLNGELETYRYHTRTLREKWVPWYSKKVMDVVDKANVSSMV